MSETARVVNVRLPHATRQRQLTVALGSILLAVILALTLLWLLAYQSVIASAQAEPDIDPYATRLELSWYGSAGEILRQPSGIAFDAVRQRVLVTDSRRAKIYVLTPQCELITSFDGGNTPELMLELPTSIAVASTGQIYVVDASQGRIVLFDEYFKPIRAIRFVEEPPKAVAVIADRAGREHLWVLSYSGLSRANLDGEFDWGYFARGSAPGRFANPSDLTGLSTETSTTVFVVDTFNHRIQALDVVGDTMAVVWMYGAAESRTPPDTEAEYTLASGSQVDRQPSAQLLDVAVSIATDGIERVFVLDGLGASVLTLDANTGELITAFGSAGSQEGQLLYPSAIAYGNERLWVVDQGNARVLVFAQAETAVAPRPIRQGFTVELLWILVLLLAVGELVCLLWLASIHSSRLIFSMDALERIEDRGEGEAVSHAVEHINVAPGIEAFAREVCADARIATVQPKRRSIKALEPLREHLSEHDFTTLASARSQARGVVVCGGSSPLFSCAIQAGIPAIDITELIQDALSLIEGDSVEGEHENESEIIDS